METKQQEDRTIPLAAKCEACEKEGWIGNDLYPEGDIRHRLFFVLGRKVFCEECVGQRHKKSEPPATNQSPENKDEPKKENEPNGNSV